MNQNHLCGWKIKQCPKNVLTPPYEPESLEWEFSSSLRSQSCSGWCVSLVCEWQLSCFKLPIDLVSHGLAHGPWREAFVCSQPCTLPICCWDGLQCCHHPHQQQEDLCFFIFQKMAKVVQSCFESHHGLHHSLSRPYVMTVETCQCK